MLLEMLRYRRPARSKTENQFIRRYLDSIPGIYEDDWGNRILECPGSKVMISTHTDTVHRFKGIQRIQASGGIIQLASGEVISNCLGADDTAGVYAALRMIQAGVKATFVFHRDEEIGGKGSSWLADNYPDWIMKHDICLALDRRGTKDIITSQWMGDCASPEFAVTLSKALGMGHEETQGSFTDSANYAHLIPECSNLSIGYQNEHTERETLDTVYLEKVIEKLIGVDWERIAVVRDPAVDEDKREWWDDNEISGGALEEEMIEEF